MEAPCQYQQSKLSEIKGRLVAGGVHGKLHVLTEKGDTWETFVRKNGTIWAVVCQQDLCLVLVKDTKKGQMVIEQFCIDEDNKWRPLTVLPNELQSAAISIAIHDSSLYAMGGLFDIWKKVSTARVWNIGNNDWSNLSDMQIRRDSCSCVIVNNTLFVGGGWNEGCYPCNSVEALCVRSGKWRTVTSTSSYLPTLTAACNGVVATGGKMLHSTLDVHSAVVQVYEDRVKQWLPLPDMTHTRWAHGAFSPDKGGIVATGGWGTKSTETLNFI